MCGICGVISFPPEDLDPQITARMIGSLRHRGPDDQGSYFSRAGRTGVFLGHTRLSVLDLSSAGRQPLCNETGRIWVIFNGEIYNFLSLREELEVHGHLFSSKTDSEVLVHAYEQYGDDFVRRLDGMFALALWDEDRERLILARDRAGKKPLYYWPTTHGLVFGSEIKALLAYPVSKPELNLDAIPLYFTYGYVPSPGTFYRGILQIPPASYLVVEAGHVRGPFSFWNFNYPRAGQERRISEEQACRELRELLDAAVRRRLISDVPLGAFLSGGIDSSLVVGLMSRHLPGKVKTFSIGFAGDKDFDETHYARIVAKHFQTDHTEFIVEPKAFELVERLLWHHDQPYGDSSAVPTYLLSQLAREHVTVALNGDGGDELFAGYERFLGAVLSAGVPDVVAKLGSQVLGALPKRWRSVREVRRAHRFLLQVAKPLPDRYLAWCSFFSQDLLAELLLNPSPVQVRESFDRCFEDTEGRPLLHRLLYLNFKTYLPDDLLVKMDRMSMAHALETRSPFLDTALVEYVATLPPQYKLKHGTLKYILKKAYADLLPAEILQRGKQGFGVPLATWFRGELKSLLGDLLLTGSPRYEKFVQRACVERLFREHQEGLKDRGGHLWTLMNFELWLRRSETSMSLIT